GAARDGVVQMRADVVGAYDGLPADSPWRSLCRLVEGTSYHLTGDRDTAQTLLEEGSRRGGAEAPHVQTLCLAQLALISLDESDQERASARADLAIAEVAHFALAEYPTSGLVFAVAALVRARAGRTQDASADLRKATELMSSLSEMTPSYEAEIRVVVARTLLLLDDVPGARAQLAQAARYLRQADDAVVIREWIERAWEEVDTAGSVVGR